MRKSSCSLAVKCPLNKMAPTQKISEEERRRRKRESERKRRAKRRENLEMRLEDQLNRKERYERGKQNKTIKMIEEMSSREQRNRRKQWKESSRHYRERKKILSHITNELSNQKPTPILLEVARASKNVISCRNKVIKDRAETFARLAELTKKYKIAICTANWYKHKYFRLLQTLKQNKTPKSGAEKLMKNILTKEGRGKYVSKHHNSTMDADDSDYDQEGEIGDEEEQNYDSSNNLGVAIKIEPGLGDEDSISEDFPIKEEVRDPLDDMLDIDVSTSIKQENDYIDQNCAITEIRIKTEPNFSDDDIHDDSSQNYSKDSNEGCSQAELQKAVNADKDQEINNVGTVSKNTNGRDENQVFGDFIAGELRNLKSEENRKKLKSIIQNVMNEMSGTQE